MVASRHFLARCFHYVEAIKRLYSNANTHAKRTGQRLLSWEQIEQRLEICKSCEHFTGKRCKICDCCTNNQANHFNKLAFPTEQCPDSPPRWEAVG